MAQLRKEKEASENDDSSSLLKVAEVLGSVGASGFLSSAMGSSGIPKDLSAGSGAGIVCVCVCVCVCLCVCVCVCVCRRSTEILAYNR